MCCDRGGSAVRIGRENEVRRELGSCVAGRAGGVGSRRRWRRGQGVTRARALATLQKLISVCHPSLLFLLKHDPHNTRQPRLTLDARAVSAKVWGVVSSGIGD